MRADRRIEGGKIAVAVFLAWIAHSGSGCSQEFGASLSGMQLWEVGYWKTVALADFYGPNYKINKINPISLAGCRNGSFSGYVVVTSCSSPITGLKAKISDLADKKTGKKIPASQAKIRYPELAHNAPHKTWSPPYRFDRMLDEPPEEVKMVDLRGWRNWKPKNEGPIAMQPIWVTIRVPKDAAPGDYEGTLEIESDLNKVPPVAVKIRVADWTLPDPKEFRVTNFGQSSPESLALHYGVPRWSDKHFELIGKSLALMAEVNSRQAIVDLCIDFYGMGGSPETMVRWIRQPDGTFKHDFSIFDKYLDTVNKAIGKPVLLRLNCWGEWMKDTKTEEWKWNGPSKVTLLDPATGKTEPLEQPRADTPEFVAFWKPVLDEVRKKLEARGWFDVAAMGANSYCWGVSPKLVDAFHAIWPDGKWSYTAHNGTLGMHFKGSDGKVSMPCLHTDHIWGPGPSGKEPRGYKLLLKPRPNWHCFTFRGWRCEWELSRHRGIPEEEIRWGHDGVSDFGVDFFPVRGAGGRIYALGNGRGTGGPNCSTLAILSPGDDGPTVNERFEALREGMQIAEAIIFVQKGIDSGKLPPDLADRANKVLEERVKRLTDSFLPQPGSSGNLRFEESVYMEKAEERENELFAVAGEISKTLKK